MNGHLVPSHLAFVVQLAVEQLPEVKCIVNGLNDTHALVALILLAQAPPVHVVRVWIDSFWEEEPFGV